MSYTDQNFETTAASHTPGPWHLKLERIGLRQDTRAYILGPNGREDGVIASANLSTLRGPEDEAARVANARLIAAAPDLLAALQNIEANLTGRDNFAERVADSLRRAKEAIVKATGREA